MKPFEARPDEKDIRALVARLARPHASGGKVVERPAILADGADFVSVIGWIIAHGGKAEGASPARGRGLHGPRPSGADAVPRRFVLPPGALAES
jgi:hypothetical protein